jgi:spore coat protein U-like protein
VKIPLKCLALCCAVVALQSLTTAQAATKTGTFNVTANIVAECNLTAVDLGFGQYESTAATTTDVNSSMNIYCTTGTTYTVALNAGTGGGTVAARTMVSGVNTLPFNLYSTAARTAVWGDGTLSTVLASGTGSGLLTANPLTVYGRIAVGLDRPPGNYASVITVTVTF